MQPFALIESYHSTTTLHISTAEDHDQKQDKFLRAGMTDLINIHTQNDYAIVQIVNPQLSSIHTHTTIAPYSIQIQPSTSRRSFNFFFCTSLYKSSTKLTFPGCLTQQNSQSIFRLFSINTRSGTISLVWTKLLSLHALLPLIP